MLLKRPYDGVYDYIGLVKFLIFCYYCINISNGLFL